MTATLTPTATPTPSELVRILPGGLNFRNVRVGRTSGVLSARVVNPRTKTNKGAVTITGVQLQSQISQFPPTGFAIQAKNTTCVSGASLPAGKICYVRVRFTPLATGKSLDALIITGTFIESGQLPVALTGIGK